jgi:hypothetical protein
MKKIKSVRSLAEFVKQVSGIRRAWRDEFWVQPWFRGQRNVDWSLLPNMWRQGQDFDLFTEYEFRDEFQRRGVQLAVGQRLPTNSWEWYFTIQHYRGRTRLLDWTDAALTALYFAISDGDLDADAVVWVLDPFWLNRQHVKRDSVLLPSWEEALPYLPELYDPDAKLPEKPAAIDPPHVTARFSAQHSRFTIHGSSAMDLRELAGLADSRLIAITINRLAAIEIRRDLNMCGLVETSIYPDLEGLARELSQVYATEWISDGTSRPKRVSSSPKGM